MIDETVEPLEPVIEVPSDTEIGPEATASVVQVISVDELLERLAQEAAEEAIETVDDEADIPLAEPDPILSSLKDLIDTLVDLGKIEKHTKEIAGDTDEIQLDVMTIAQTLDHPALTTSFADYTVTEALLLLLLLAAFLSACARMLRGGFSWLRS